MFNIENYAGFIVAILAFQMFPGAGTVNILNATGRGGLRAGMSTVFGTLTGDFIYMLAAVLGLATVLSAYPNMLATVQWIGAIYLCWIGWKLLRLPVSERSNDHTAIQDNWSNFRQGLVVSLTNPKVIIFFMAFFPLFLRADSDPSTLLILMAHVSFISLLFQAGLVFMGNAVALRLSKWRHIRLFATRFAGVAFIGFGAKLALGSR